VCDKVRHELREDVLARAPPANSSEAASIQETNATCPEDGDTDDSGDGSEGVLEIDLVTFGLEFGPRLGKVDMDASFDCRAIANPSKASWLYCTPASFPT